MNSVVPTKPVVTEAVVAKAEDNLALGRMVVVKKAPYVSSILYGFMSRPTTKVPTMAVTKGMNLLYNPIWVNAQSETRLGAAYFHEVGHWLRQHLDRGAAFPNKKLFNKAADMPMNDDMREAEWDTGPEWLYPETYNLPPNLTAEEYYPLLEQQQEKKSSGEDENGEGVGQGSCGGCSCNPGNDEEESEADAEDSHTEADIQRFCDEAYDAIKKEAAKGQGTVPEWMKEMAEAALEPPKVPWQRKVQSVIRKSTGQIISGGYDFSMARPSKRSALRGFPRPGMIDCTPDIVFAIDSSASMDIQTQIKDALREACGCMKSCGVDTVWVIQSDARVAEIKKMSVNDLRKMEIKGRGGTSFIPAIEAAVKLKPRPNLMVYFTDGAGTAPDSPPPGMGFIWCIVPSSCAMKPAKWGMVVVAQDGTHPFELPE